MARVLLLLVLWVAQITAVAVFVNSEWLQHQIVEEKRAVHAYLGTETATKVTQLADIRFESWLVDSGVVNAVTQFLIPDPSVPKHGTDGLAPWFFTWLDDSLTTFWYVIYQAVYRFLLLAEWAPYLGVLVAASILDGLVERQIQKKNYGYANPVRYRAGIRSLAILSVVPFLYLTMPLHVSPLLVPIWMFGAALILMVVTANAQHRI